MPEARAILALAAHIDEDAARHLARELPESDGWSLGILLGAAYPPLRPSHGWQMAALDAIAADGWRTSRRRDPLLGRLVQRLGGDATLERTREALRRAAWAEKARVALRELLPPALGGAGVMTTARELSVLAEVCLELALREATAHVARRHGEPRRSDASPSSLVVFGMGKLGGRELNAGSDIDIVLMYDTDDGESAVSLHEHWTQVAQRAVATLDQPTGDGVVWRVDLRLRPEGSRGPLVYSWSAAERYYETWGRLWERAALSRARAVAGDLDLGAALEREVIRPFVYRRGVDPSIATSLASLVEQSRAELSADPARDLKLGPGGIREAEFFVQALQLIWGGREPTLRVTGTLGALERLRSKGLVSDREAQTVLDGYALLRGAEHAIQWRSGVQTHSMPESESERGVLARCLGYPGAQALAQALSGARERIAALFASILPEAARPPSRHVVLLGHLERSDPGLDEAIEEVFGDAEISEHLVALARRPDGLLGELTRERFPELADQVLDALADSSDPLQAARYLRSCFGRFISPTPYIAPFAEDPHALVRLVTVLGASVFVGDALLALPELTDLLLFQASTPSAERARRIVSEEVGAFEHRRPVDAEAHEEIEEFVGALRRAKAKVVVETAMADLAGELDPREATRVLSALADRVIEECVRFEMGAGRLGLCVIAVGKLGGRDIGYGSDLDVLFVYDRTSVADPAIAADEAEAAAFFTRRAQRIIRLVTDRHPAGPGYELDTRLRPSGSQGLLVSSIEAFARYHGVPLEGDGAPDDHPMVFSSGAAWERQALLRARVCAGDAELGARVMRVAARAAYERGAPAAEEVHRLRLRMQRELGRERKDRFDLKTGRGGLLDIEFCTQWLQMRYGRDERVRTEDTLEALAALRGAGYLSQRHFETLRDGYLFLRRLEQRIRVLHGGGSTVLQRGGAGLGKLARRMGLERLPGAAEEQTLLEAYRDVTVSVRRAYAEILGVEEDA